MIDLIWIYNLLEKFPSWILALILVILIAIYNNHIKSKNDYLSEIISRYEIIKSINKEHGQVTIFPNSVKKAGTSGYKYIYNCTLQINAIESFPDGFNMQLTSSKEFKIKSGSSLELESIYRKPNYSIDLNSELFTTSHYSSSRMNLFDFSIHSNQKRLDLDIKIDFGSGSIHSKVFLNP